MSKWKSLSEKVEYTKCSLMPFSDLLEKDEALFPPLAFTPGVLISLLEEKEGKGFHQKLEARFSPDENGLVRGSLSCYEEFQLDGEKFRFETSLEGWYVLPFPIEKDWDNEEATVKACTVGEFATSYNVLSSNFPELPEFREGKFEGMKLVSESNRRVLRSEGSSLYLEYEYEVCTEYLFEGERVSIFYPLRYKIWREEESGLYHAYRLGESKVSVLVSAPSKGSSKRFTVDVKNEAPEIERALTEPFLSVLYNPTFEQKSLRMWREEREVPLKGFLDERITRYIESCHDELTRELKEFREVFWRGPRDYQGLEGFTIEELPVANAVYVQYTLGRLGLRESLIKLKEVLRDAGTSSRKINEMVADIVKTAKEQLTGESLEERVRRSEEFKVMFA